MFWGEGVGRGKFWGAMVSDGEVGMVVAMVVKVLDMESDDGDGNRPS